MKKIKEDICAVGKRLYDRRFIVAMDGNISVRLKDLASEYGVFILSSTQLNASYVDGQTFDQNLLRGAKAIADKLDAGMIMLPVTDEDKESLNFLIINC